MKKCPGGKIRSQGKGKGLGSGDKKGPRGVPSSETRKNRNDLRRNKTR